MNVLVMRWRVLSVLVRLIAVACCVPFLVWMAHLPERERLLIICGATILGIAHFVNSWGTYCWHRADEIREWRR